MYDVPHTTDGGTADGPEELSALRCARYLPSPELVAFAAAAGCPVAPDVPMSHGKAIQIVLGFARCVRARAPDNRSSHVPFTPELALIVAPSDTQNVNGVSCVPVAVLADAARRHLRLPTAEEA